MPRPEGLPAVVSTRHGNVNSSNCSWRSGRVGESPPEQSDELWLQLNHGQVLTSADEQAAAPETFWGWTDVPENVWERVYNEPALPQGPQNLTMMASRRAAR
jgi:hypothetical protein